MNITTQKYESDYQDISGDVVTTNSTRPCSRLHVADLGEPPGDVVTSMETGRCHNYLVEVDQDDMPVGNIVPAHWKTRQDRIQKKLKKEEMVLDNDIQQLYMQRIIYLHNTAAISNNNYIYIYCCKAAIR